MAGCKLIGRAKVSLNLGFALLAPYLSQARISKSPDSDVGWLVDVSEAHGATVACRTKMQITRWGNERQQFAILTFRGPFSLQACLHFCIAPGCLSDSLTSQRQRTKPNL